MSDLELLFLILALLYAWECLAWLPRGSVAFTTWLGRHWQMAQPSTIFGNQRGGFVLAAPLPPLGSFLVTAPWFSPGGESAEAGEQPVRNQFDLSEARQRWESCRQHSRGLRRVVNGLFLYLFVAVPVLITQLGLKRTWLGLLAGLLGLMITEAVLFFRAHRALYPAAADDRFTRTLTIALSPATAMRAHDVLTRPLLQAFHPLVPARMFLDHAAFVGYAGRILRDLRHPLPQKNASPQSAETQGQAVLLHELEDFLKQNDVDPGMLLRPPVPVDATCRAYCPRCLTQFTNAEGTCADCGLPLVAFEGKVR